MARVSTFDLAVLRNEVDQRLLSGVEAALQRAMAHARLQRALVEMADALGHPAVTIDCRTTGSGPTYRLGSSTPS